MVSIVVAHSRNRVIGNRGGLPWHLPSDMRRFRELTSGAAVVMGRRTYESLPDAFRPLPRRRNVVVSSNAEYECPGAELHTSLDAALEACERHCFVIGGGAVYAEAMPLVDRLYVTHVDADVEGDAFFPPLAGEQWRCTTESDPVTENGFPYVFKVYDRVR
ncbi:MAG TPA: dihydrofolate reductase [Thermoleophilaceae bacterium]|jgi:dihydrofolate reductase